MPADAHGQAAPKPRKRWPWYRPILRNWRRYYLRQFPRKKRLHGGLLHRVLGNRLFDPGLWVPTQSTVAKGVAIGTFIGLLPFLGLQILLSLILCFIFRVNVTAAVLATFLSNPLTAGGIIYLQVQVGKWLSGPMDPPVLAGKEGALDFVVRIGWPLLIGALATASAGALLAYPLTLMLWNAFSSLGGRGRHVQSHEKD